MYSSDWLCQDNRHMILCAVHNPSKQERPMKGTSDQQSSHVEPSSPGRRTFVKGIAAMGAGVAAFPLLTTTAEAKALAAGNRFPSQSGGAMGALQASQTFQGDKIGWHGF